MGTQDHPGVVPASQPGRVREGFSVGWGWGDQSPEEKESTLPALAHSPTQREMGEKEGERWGGGKRCPDGEGWEG